MAQLTPYLFFKGNCKEAMTFYKDCLGGALDIKTVGESPGAAHMPPENQNSVMHAALTTDSMVLMASDLMDSGPRVVGNAISLTISGVSVEQLKMYFAKLSEGGKVTKELKEEFFGTYGDLVDKYGIRWMFQAERVKK